MLGFCEKLRGASVRTGRLRLKK